MRDAYCVAIAALGSVRVLVLRESSDRLARFPELDVLRGIAVILVLGRHIIFIPSTLPPVLYIPLALWREIGWIGVNLFFVLSGFLVAGLLFREFQRRGIVNITRFLIRRGFKIYPSFYLMILASLVTPAVFVLPNPVGLSNIIGEITFLQNYIGRLWNHTISIGIEEQFYLLMATTALFLIKLKDRWVSRCAMAPYVILSLCVMILIARTVLVYSNSFETCTAVPAYTHLRFDSLLWGVLIAYGYHFKQDIFVRVAGRLRSSFPYVVYMVTILPILFPFSKSCFMHSLGFTTLDLGFGLIISLSVVGKSAFQSRVVTLMVPIAAVGRISYSIYLWHMLVFFGLKAVIPLENSNALFYTHTILYLCFSLLIGVVMHRLVEHPMLRIRDRYFP